MSSLTAKEVLTQETIVLNPGMKVFEVAGILRTCRIGGAPVVDEQRNVVGVITVTDLFRFIDKLKERLSESKGTGAPEVHKIRLETCVGDIMTRNIISVKANTLLDEILDLMLRKNIHTLPVTAEDGKKIVGIIGRHDVCLAYLMGQAITA